MSAVLLNHPAKAAELVCHDEQLMIWADDLIGLLSMEDWLKDALSYDDGIDLQKAVMRELKSIITMAFTHPELQPKK